MKRDRLPPNQSLTVKFPVVGENNPGCEIDLDAWRLVLEGEVDEAKSFTYNEILAFPQLERKTDVHCVTGWSRFDTVFCGFALRDLIANSGVKINSEARFVRFLAYSSRSHDVSLPLDTALEDCWLVHSADGEPLTTSRGFPLRVLTPSKYLYKSLKWVHRIQFLREDRLGFWERTSGYHNDADPWREQRLSAHRFTNSAEANAFKALEDFSTFRNPEAPRVIVKADFQGWRPATCNLSELQLKACSFRNADLRGCDFRDANLTLSRFPGARLEGVDFTGADLEGADFAGAYLAGAVFDRNFLSATTFRVGENGLESHEGMRVENPDGLLESQADYLREIGVLASH